MCLWEGSFIGGGGRAGIGQPCCVYRIIDLAGRVILFGIKDAIHPNTYRTREKEGRENVLNLTLQRGVQRTPSRSSM